MVTQATPSSPSSTSSYSLVHSLDALSLSTGSFDLVSNPSSASHPSSTSNRSHNTHSRQTSSSGSLISAPRDQYDHSVDRRSSVSASEDEVVLPPRSMTSSMTGGSVYDRTSRTGTPVVTSPSRVKVQGKKEIAASGSASFRVKSEPIDTGNYGTASQGTTGIGLTKSELKNIDKFSKVKAKKIVERQRQNSSASSEAWSVSEKEDFEAQYQRLKREKIQRKLEAKASASARETGSEAGSFSGISSGDVVKVEGGKGKGKKTRRSGTSARRRAENEQMGSVEDALGGPGSATPSTPKPKKGKTVTPTTYNISGTPRVIDQSALELLTGIRGSSATATPAKSTAANTPKLQQASLQKLHLLELLNTESESGSSSSGSIQTDDDEDDDEEDEDDEDEIDDNLTDLGTPEVYTDVKGHTPISRTSSGVSGQRRRRVEGSIISADDARSSIDDFLADPTHRMTKDETLRFWQSLCFELGLADLDEDAPYLPDLPSTASSTTSSTSYTESSSSRSTTPTQLSRPMPQTLIKAKALLKAEGHVNIADYFDARGEDQDPATAKQEPSKGGRYAHLVQPSANSMRKYTKTSGRFVQLEWVKAEAMQPLLRDFGFKRGREMREGRQV